MQGRAQKLEDDHDHDHDIDHDHAYYTIGQVDVNTARAPEL